MRFLELRERLKAELAGLPRGIQLVDPTDAWVASAFDSAELPGRPTPNPAGDLGRNSNRRRGASKRAQCRSPRCCSRPEALIQSSSPCRRVAGVLHISFRALDRRAHGGMPCL